MTSETTEPAAAAPLDLLLTDAALGVLHRVVPDGSGLRLAAALAARPRLVAGRTRNLLGELTRIAAGTSQVQPSRRDRRFADPGWAGNPLLRRALQAYLAAAQTAEGLAQDADLDWADTERAGFVLTNLIAAFSAAGLSTGLLLGASASIRLRSTKPTRSVSDQSRSASCASPSAVCAAAR